MGGAVLSAQQGGAGGRGRAPPRGRGRPTAARRSDARVRAQPLASLPEGCGPQARHRCLGTALPMSSCPCSLFFRVTLVAASLLRPQQCSRPLAVRAALRQRSQAPGKCAASPQPPGFRHQPSIRPRPLPSSPAWRGSVDWESVPTVV